MKKRIMSITLIFMVIFAFVPGGPVLASSDVRVTIDGQPVEFTDQTPQIIDGRTLVPVRDVFESLGFYVYWSESRQTAILSRYDLTLMIPVGSSTFTANNVEFELDVPAQIINGRTMLPIRAPLESVGYIVEWNPYTWTVEITTTMPEADYLTISWNLRGGSLYYMIQPENLTSFQFVNRYTFEQFILPAHIFASMDYVVYMLNNENADAMIDFVLDLWTFQVAIAILYEMPEAVEHLHNDMNYGEIFEYVNLFRSEIGLGDDHIADISFAALDAETNAFIIELKDVETRLLSTFIGIAYNEAKGLRVFSLEQSFELDGEVLHMFCVLDIVFRGSFRLVENSREAFSANICEAMAGTLTLSSSLYRNLFG